MYNSRNGLTNIWRNEMDIREGDAKYEGLMREWLREKKPAKIQVGGVNFEVIQDARDKKYYFHEVSEMSGYNSRSWGG